MCIGKDSNSPLQATGEELNMGTQHRGPVEPAQEDTVGGLLRTAPGMHEKLVQQDQERPRERPAAGESVGKSPQFYLLSHSEPLFVCFSRQSFFCVTIPAVLGLAL